MAQQKVRMNFKNLFIDHAINKALIVIIIPILCCSFFGYALYHNFTVFELLENHVYDLRVKTFRSDKTGSEKLILVLIDAESLRAMKPIIGQWPWPRSIFKKIILHLKSQDVETVIIDIIFAGADIEHVTYKPRKEEDILLVQGTKEAGNVFHGMTIINEQHDEFKDLLPKEFIEKFAINAIIQPQALNQSDLRRSFEIPFKELYNVAYGIGVENYEPDKDGVFRRIPFFKKYKDDIFPMMPFAVFIKLNQVTFIQDDREKYIFHSKRGYNYAFLKDESGEYLINYYNRFKTISIKDILLPSQDHSNNLLDLKHKIALIGVSAPELGDLVNTPIGNNIPGFMVHASAISDILNGDYLKEINKKQTIIYTLLSCIIMSLMACYLTSRAQIIIISIIFYVSILLTSFYLFRYNLVLKIVIPAICIAVTWFISFLLSNKLMKRRGA